MKIALGSDHAGYDLKEKVKRILSEWGESVTDFGTYSKESCDYSDFALKVAQSVASGEADRGVAICWTGNGVTITANKVAGIRATLAINPEMARLAREHNDSNVLTLPSKYINDSDIEKTLKAWLESKFEGGRHRRRLAKIPDSGITE